MRLEELAGRAELGRSSPEQSRRELAASVARVAGIPPRVGSISDRDAGGIPVRIYRPPGPTAGAGPAVVFFHGGGGVAGTIDTHDEPCRLLCAGLPATVVSVEYRLAPEHPFPAAVEDG
ncbi:MAG TPA: alpha/beta hydrolase, partial [Kofleriaceae bacterium]|nr:alpha/beta hydrolase [Kofleriaceae bacterium]